jgi:hypothetical protein
VQIRIHARSKNYRLSILTGGKPVLSAPPYAKLREAEEFLYRHSDWLKNRLDSLPKIIPFIDGAVIILRGFEHRLIMDNRLRGIVNVIEHDDPLQMPILQIPGGQDFMARRLTDWLKRQAKSDLEKSVEIHAKNLEVFPKAISIRSQSTRWGSCSSSGKLNFNWRLVLAPSFVLDYVAAHEVAHLIEMNHSKAFWDQVRRTLPDMEKGKKWLKKNGNQLMVYG